MDRRALLLAAAALSITGCSRVQASPSDVLPALKSLAPYPLGTCVSVNRLDDAQWSQLAATHFSRLTPEWEMKMEYILRPDGNLLFDRPDAIVAFARQHGMAVHGHTLIWYAEEGGDYFAKLAAGSRDAFLNGYAGYVQAVMGRYKGQFPSWDVVNEPMRDDGSGLRDCLWRKALGDDYIGLALTAAREADPHALLFINDYWLEKTPKKRLSLLKVVEGLLKDGAPLHGIGTQTHIDGGLVPGMIRDAIRDIASLGLKVHVSEVDISTQEDRPTSIAEPRADQIRLLAELVQAYGDVPARQRHGMTFWGLRDSDSWINHEKGHNPLMPDEPCLFDGLGRPKPLAYAFADDLRHRA